MFVQIYGRLRTECGYTGAEIDAMEFDDVIELHQYWQSNPPVGMLVRAIAQVLGIKFEDRSSALGPMTYDEALRFTRITGGSVTTEMIRNMMAGD